MRGMLVERVGKEMMEWMYGSDEGEAKGSPAVVDWKLARKGSARRALPFRSLLATAGSQKRS